MGQSKRRLGERPAPDHVIVGRSRRQRSDQASAPVVVVTSDLTLVAETVAAALVSRGLVAWSVPWQGLATSAGTGEGEEIPEPQVPAADVILVIRDIDSPVVLRDVRRWARGCRCPWVVMSDAARDPAWGGVLEVGARAVLRSTMSLPEVIAVLEMVARGRTPLRPRDRSELVGRWHRFNAQRRAAAARLDTLSPREAQVLRLLYEGTTVREIAELVGISTSTVRSQVRGVLRKLGVDNQLAAVAVLSELEEGSTDDS